MVIDPGTYALATGLILVVSILFSMLGMGGSMLYVPILHWLGLPLKALAIPLGLLLNGVTTLSAFIGYARRGLVDIRGGLPAAVAGLIMAPLGARLVEVVPRETLILLFAGAVAVAALRTLWQARAPEPERLIAPARRAIVGAAVGGFAGFVAGLLGIGGGFIVAPMLMTLGYPTKRAAATTSFVVVFSSFSGFLGHVAAGHIEPLLATLTVVAVILGSQLGSWLMASKARPSWVKWAYGVLLLAVAAKLAASILVS